MRAYGPVRRTDAAVVPFLTLNHQLDDDRYLRRMIRDCAAAGLDGVFLHAREGLRTPYLSEAWFEAVGVCVEEARRAGLKVWLYDEFPYPSGVAGGKVVEANPAFAERHLRITRHRVHGGRYRLDLGSDPVLGAFLVSVDGQQTHDVTACIGPCNDTWIVRKDWDSRYYYAPRYSKVYPCPRSCALEPRQVFEGEVPAGTWELVVFRVRTGGDFVEPFGHYVDVSNRNASAAFVAFTHEQYRQRFGCYFGNTIPGIFTDEPKFRNALPWSDTIAAHWEDYRRNRRALLALVRGGAAAERYRATVMRLFRDHWVRPVAAWCRQHKLKLTGHISPEEQWWQEAALTGSIAQLLKEFDIPGCDLIIPAVGDRDHPILNFTPTLAVSVAAQQGRPQALCEVFGANHYTLTLQDMKRIGDWLAWCGINVFVNHALIGWLDGYRKYDAPPTFYRPSPLWPHLKTWADHVRAVANELGPAGIQPDVVVVRPMRTLWRLVGDDQRAARILYERAMRLAQQLLERGRMVHWVDDLDLGAIRVVGEWVHVGQARYRALIYLDGSLDDAAQRNIARVRAAGATVLTDAQATAIPGPLECRSGAVRVVRSRQGRWFAVNLASTPQRFTVEGQPYRLEGYESRWLGSPAPARRVVRRVVLPDRWEIQPQDDNVLVLTRWEVNGRGVPLAPYYEWAPAESVGPTKRCALGPIPVQPELAEPVRLEYRTRFRSDGVCTAVLVIEGETIRGKWTATLNGTVLRAWRRRYRFDPTNRECRVSLREGWNELVFAVVVRRRTDGMLEPCRLYGQFEVRRGDLVPAKPIRGRGDWCRLGYPYYSGTMVYAQQFVWASDVGRQVELVLTQPPRDHAVVVLNGQQVGGLLWSPWRLDVTSALRPGRNRLELHVSNSLTNLLMAEPRPSGLFGRAVLERR